VYTTKQTVTENSKKTHKYTKNRKKRNKNTFCRVASTEPRRRLRSSASSADLVVPATRRSTLRWVTAPSLSLIHVHGTVNSLPDAIRHNSSLAVFKSSLRTYLFTLPDP